MAPVAVAVACDSSISPVVRGSSILCCGLWPLQPVSVASCGAGSQEWWLSLLLWLQYYHLLSLVRGSSICCRLWLRQWLQYLLSFVAPAVAPVSVAPVAPVSVVVHGSSSICCRSWLRYLLYLLSFMSPVVSSVDYDSSICRRLVLWLQSSCGSSLKKYLSFVAPVVVVFSSSCSSSINLLSSVAPVLSPIVHGSSICCRSWLHQYLLVACGSSILCCLWLIQ